MMDVSHKLRWGSEMKTTNTYSRFLIVAALLWTSGCTLVSSFNDYTFEQDGAVRDGSSRADAGMDATLDASRDAQGTDAADATTDTPINPDIRHELHVVVAGRGAGIVAMEGNDFACADDCRATFPENTEITMVASPDSHSVFESWSGLCDESTETTCTFRITEATNIFVTFGLPRYTVTVERFGLGASTGRITDGSALFIDCGSDCSQDYEAGEVITLSAATGSEARFVGWSGACHGLDCQLTVTRDWYVGATFDTEGHSSVLVTPSGTGRGSIVADIPGDDVELDCGNIDDSSTICSASYEDGETVTLTAIPEEGTTFEGWGGACVGTELTCVVTLDGALSVTANFHLNTYDLNVAVDSGGSVTSNEEAGIACGTVIEEGISLDCAETLGHGTEVTLTATPREGYMFTGWSLPECGSDAECTFDMTENVSVYATFAVTRFPVIVTVTGSGDGTVTSSPSGINACSGLCNSSYDYGTVVTLYPVAMSGSTFVGWSGACTGTGNCEVTTTALRNITATFTEERFQLSVAPSFDGGAAGTISDTGGFISCGATCDHEYAYGSPVELTATASAGTFVGWGGACASFGDSPTCMLAMTSDLEVGATFSTGTNLLVVTPAGTGTGTVSSSPEGISCGLTCVSAFAADTVVALTATPNAGSGFTGWTGACEGFGACEVTVSGIRDVGATFDLGRYATTVAFAGTGDGTVVSSDDSIHCESADGGTADCDQTSAFGTTITLTAAPDTGSVFDGWSGAGCSGTGPCVVTVEAAATVTASFSLDNFDITVSKSGTGSGAVNSALLRIACGDDCAETYEYGRTVTITATPATGSSFLGWSGALCSGTSPSCTFTVTTDGSITALFGLNSHSLTVSKSGSGAGTITSDVAGVSCGTDCSETYNYGTTVVLTAAASEGSAFDGWSGACSGTAATCSVTFDQAYSVGASFTIQTRSLSVSKSGTGTGTLASSPAGIACGATCSSSYNYGQSVVLTATADSGSTVSGWGGDCSSATGATCTVAMTAARTASATFALNSYTVAVTKSGVGTGTVTASSGAVNCGATCSGSYAHGTSLTLTATPTGDSVFSGWGGACSGTSSTCTVAVTEARSVTANFALNTYLLSVTKAGAGSGSVTAPDSTINCGATCSANYNSATVVTLSASPAAGSTFSGWSGACSGTSSCVVTMSVARSVTATFAVSTLGITVTSPTGGTVTSDSGGISCGANCTASYNYGSAVVLTATPSTGYTFTSWGGACSGTTTTCALSMTSARSVTATFTPINYLLSVTKSPSAGGTVSAAAATPPLSCGTACASTSQSYAYGTSVTLTAAAADGYTFAGWGGDCAASGTTATCAVSMSAAKTVSATFVVGTTVLSVAKAGTGAGSVTSATGDINCGSTCGASYTTPATVVLTAAASTGSTFAGWSGACTGTGTCTVVMSAARSVTATFTLSSYTVTVAKTGTGTGGVTASSGSLSCGTTCSASYDYGTMLTLTATATAGSTFSGWGGACSGASTTCAVTVSAATAVTANFALNSYTLTASKSGAGSGTIAASTGALSCGTTCAASYSHGTSVVLTATAATGSTFAGWGGECSAAVGNTCTLSMTAARSASATFTLNTYTVSFAKAGAGSGTVASSDGTLSCGPSCSTTSPTFAYGTSVTLTASPSDGSSFGSWSGGTCSGSTSPCTFTVTGSATVTATFALISRTLTVTKNGTGTGTVASPGITCGTTCSASYPNGTMLTLTATPSTGSTFTGWSGGVCSGASTTCNLTMDAAKAVTATFTANTYALGVTVTLSATTAAGTVTTAGVSPSISCSSGVCSATYTHGTSVTLTATPEAASSRFTGWSGAGCSGTGTCTVAMTQVRAVTASFAPAIRRLQVTPPTGGTVASVGTTDINCGTICSKDYTHGSSVTLSATPTTGYVFGSWATGPCAGSALDTCDISMTAATSVSATFLRLYTVTLVPRGSGVGGYDALVQDSTTENNCYAPTLSVGGTGAGCSFEVPSGTALSLSASVPAWAYFSGWTNCTAAIRPTQCTRTVSANVTIYADFTARANLAFVSSTMVSGDLGGIGKGDDICNSAAAGANLPGTYVAWLSDSTTSARDRTYTTSTDGAGWVRIDGRTFSDSWSALVGGGSTSPEVRYPLELNENGTRVDMFDYAFTGSKSDGNADGYNCADWTAGPGSYASWGFVHAGQGSWTEYGSSRGCEYPAHLYCMGTDLARRATPADETGTKYAFVTNTALAIGTRVGYDALCQAEGSVYFPRSGKTFRAYIATSTESAASRFDAKEVYMRLDGTVVGSSAQLFTSRDGSYIGAPINQYPTGPGTYDTSRGWQYVWTGVDSGPEYEGRVTCDDWASSSPTEYGYVGVSNFNGGWASYTYGTCDNSYSIYCFED